MKLKTAGYRNHPLSDCRERRNRRIAKTRARVEHVFGAIAQDGWQGQARANFAMTMMAAGYNLKRLVYLTRAGIEACRCPQWAGCPGNRASNPSGKSNQIRPCGTEEAATGLRLVKHRFALIRDTLRDTLNHD